MEKEAADLESPHARLLALGLGLLFLGQQNKSEAMIMVAEVLPDKKYADFLVLVLETCAYACSGNVLKI